MIDEFVEVNRERSVAHTSLGQLIYLSALKHVDGVVGNSSSGLIEAPSLLTGTINIGNRQKGRTKAITVIDCLPNCEEILKALDKLYSQSFQDKLTVAVNPYGVGGASLQIAEKLKELDIKHIDIQKSFFDVDERLMKEAIEGLEINNGAL